MSGRCCVVCVVKNTGKDAKYKSKYKWNICFSLIYLSVSPFN